MSRTSIVDVPYTHLYAEGISVDIFIVDNGGTRLCTIRGFEMTRHSNSIEKPVEKRYQLEWQPVSIPIQPAEELHFIRELTRNTRDLWTTLDALAIETIKKTLAEPVVVGVEVCICSFVL